LHYYNYFFLAFLGPLSLSSQCLHFSRFYISVCM
jgi:hypothetical protein